MNKIILIVIGLTLGSCASSKKIDCDAYSYDVKSGSDTTTKTEYSK